MSEYLAAAASNVGGPEDLVMRSARARAQAAGVPVDDILRAWAGGEAAPAAAQPPVEAPDPAPVEVADRSPEPAAPDPAAPPPSEPAAVAPAIADAPPARVVAASVPETVTEAEAADWDQVTAVKTAGLKERTGSVVPTWLVALFSIIPVFAVAYLSVNNNGPACGDAGQLAVDFRNELVNCDLTAYAGAGGPGGDGGGANFIAAGREVYAGAGACAGCHGADGGGGAAGPQLSAGVVIETFSSCADHIKWVQLGTAGWSSEVGSSYGDTNKPTGGFGQMPGFGSSLSDEQIRTVVAFERVIHGLAPVDAVLTDCGLAEEAPAEDAPADDVPAEEAPEALAP